MLRRILLSVLGVLVWIGLAFWWISYWPTGVSTLKGGEDLLWRTIQNTKDGFQRDDAPPDATRFINYQKWLFVLYGKGKTPTIEHIGQTVHVKFFDGIWIFRSLGAYQEVTFEYWTTQGTLAGIWWMFIDVSSDVVANFDGEVLMNGQKLLPSFLVRNGKQDFFDLYEQKDLIANDLWTVYVSFYPIDKRRILGEDEKWEKMTRQTVDTLIHQFLDREPKSSQLWIFHRDIRVRTALEKVQDLVTKIDTGDSCWTERALCFTLLEDLLKEEKQKFPEIFTPLEQTIHAWLQLDTNIQDSGGVTWTDIFRVYHVQLVAWNVRARAVRDKAILDMIRSGGTTSNIEVWWYLTQMLASQKLGSAYSLEIVREMIRIGDNLYRSGDLSEDAKKTLANNAITSLSNLKDILQNTYFTQKEYWFVLRDDLVDNEGNTIKNQTFINELQDLIQQIDSSTLLYQSDVSTGEELRVLRAQLAWFNCIFSRNEEYVKNPRICRTTRSETSS